jgi:hypothetical protein
MIPGPNLVAVATFFIVVGIVLGVMGDHTVLWIWHHLHFNWK